MQAIRLSIDKLVLMPSLCSSYIQFSYYQVDIVTYVTRCYRLTPGEQYANISY